MTLPASGTISLSNFSTEIGNPSNAAMDMNWIYANTKSGQQAYNLANYYSKAWYQRNADGNCNNGNCACNCNCGDLNCNNCGQAPINCANCDTRAWFQNNCNCACTYNCTPVNCISFNCNCACCDGG